MSSKFLVIFCSVITLHSLNLFSKYSAFNNSKYKWMPIKNQLPTLSKLYSIYEEAPEELMDEADIDSYFYHSVLNITKKENRLVLLSNTSNKKSFNFKIFKPDCSTIQQKYSLSEAITLTRRELGVVLDCLNDFLLQFEAARQSNFYILATLKAPVGYTFLKDDLFYHHIHEIREHSKRHIRLSFRVDLNKGWIFSLEKITLTGSEFFVEKIINFGHFEVKSLLSNRKFIRSTSFLILIWILLQFWLVDRILQQIFCN